MLHHNHNEPKRNRKERYSRTIDRWNHTIFSTQKKFLMKISINKKFGNTGGSVNKIIKEASCRDTTQRSQHYNRENELFDAIRRSETVGEGTPKVVSKSN